MTGDEWNYLLNTRQAGFLKNGVWYRFWCTSIKLANNARVPGIVIFPDNANAFGGASMIAYSIIVDAPTTITVDEWNGYMQPAGCVFLPQAGRFGEDESNVAIYNSNLIHYWTSTLYADSGNPCAFGFTLDQNSAWPFSAPSRVRLPVRLVTDAN